MTAATEAAGQGSPSKDAAWNCPVKFLLFFFFFKKGMQWLAPRTWNSSQTPAATGKTSSWKERRIKFEYREERTFNTRT